MDVTAEEREYRWLDAAEFYEQKAQSSAENSSLAAEYWDRIGSCYSYASRQARTVEEFRDLRQKAVEAYETAAELFAATRSPNSQGRSAGCLAIAEYTRSWLASTPSEKEKMLDDCLRLGKKALEAFKASGDELCYGKMCNVLSLCFFDRLQIAATQEEKKQIAREGMDNTSEAISTLSKLDLKDELILALSVASLQCWYVANISEQEKERKALTDGCLNYSNEATALARENGNAYSKAISFWAASLSDLYFTDKIEASLEYAREMLKQAGAARDNYFKGMAYYLLAHITDWTVDVEANQDRKRQKYEDIIKYSEESIRHLELVCRDSAVAEVYRFYTETLSYLAREFAFKPMEKLAYSRKAVRVGERGLEHAVRSGSPEAIGSSVHALSKVFHYYSSLESRTEEKRMLLNSALDNRKRFIEIGEKAFGSNFWTRGVGLVYSAKIKADLAELEKDKERKTAVLQEAVSDMEKGITHCNNWVGSRPVPSLIAIVAGYEDLYGELLDECYLLTNEKGNLTRANKAYADAGEKFRRVDLPSRIAESCWKIARNQDVMGEHVMAAGNFERAFAEYKEAAQKIAQFSEFYLDYANYMKAWSEIQSAKLSHSSEKYAESMEHYEHTSALLKQSKPWSYLSSNFHAWAHLELAEDFSRKEKSVEAISSFEQAISLFQESERTLRSQLDRIDKADEKDLVTRLVEASSTREEYGRGRIEIENARILDKQGDHTLSSERYEAAAAIFQRISQTTSEQTQREVKPLIYLCQAWQKMTMAEARNSPTLYEEAAELFKQANEQTTNESASLLALAHCSFCKALEAGTEFEITRDARVYVEAKKHMDAAATYYLRAGFENASEYAKATQRLFDAYVFMDNAKKETDPEKEARQYLMAEKVLQVAAESYGRADHAEKTSQVRKLLKKVQEERDLAVKLSEVLHAPTITSSTASFATISPNEEKAVGLERFEHADIQAKLIQISKGARIGEDLSLAIQIVNVGKEPVFLTKVENTLPEGFEFAGKPENYTFEADSLVMKGTRLDPLKTGEIKVALKPFRKVDAEIKPRIICVDETGRQLFYELEPKTLSVAEAVLAGRVPTGFNDLDGLMFGGIPENYAVVLTSPSCDERNLLVKRFLSAGLKRGETTFYVTAEPEEAKALAEENSAIFFLFVCNPRAEVMVKNLPNVFRLKGVESLTDIDIALVKAFRMLGEQRSEPRRACIEIVSDVLLQHHAVITRKWLSGLLADLRSRGFTTLAVVNPHMHPPEEFQAILGLFEGEIRVTEKETPKGFEKVLRIRKLYNQRYLENELALNKEALNRI
ncbi:MAG: ATPase domain-containing protein [Candidatus Bathyarchaeia archaeon]